MWAQGLLLFAGARGEVLQAQKKQARRVCVCMYVYAHVYYRFSYASPHLSLLL